MGFSFDSWPFLTRDVHNQILKCSKFGLIAHASNNNISIYANEFGHYTPLHMWTPFEHPISAVGWFDASMVIDSAVPVLIVASSGGMVDVFDVRSRKTIEKFTLKNDYATSIQWSAFSLSTFFIGTQNGKFIRYEIEIGHVVKFSKVWELSFGFAINYICVEPQFGRFCSIASSNGSLAIITKIDTANPEASPDVVKLNDSADKLIDIKFYPTTIHFLVLLTESYALLYSIDESTTVALINLKSMQKFHILHDSGNVAMIVFNDSVHLWKFSINQNIRLAELPLSTSKLSGQNEISCCDMMGDKLLLVTQGGWLNTVEARNNKLFVTQRVKILGCEPLSWSLSNDAIAFSMSDGKILITETKNPNFIRQMTFKQFKFFEAQRKFEKKVTIVQDPASQQLPQLKIIPNTNSLPFLSTSDKISTSITEPEFLFPTFNPDLVHPTSHCHSEDGSHTTGDSSSKRRPKIKSWASSALLTFEEPQSTNQEILSKSIISKHEKTVPEQLVSPLSPRSRIDMSSPRKFKQQSKFIMQKMFKERGGRRSSSLVNDDQQSILAQIAKGKLQEGSRDESDNNKSKVWNQNDSPKQASLSSKTQFGNNCTIMWSYQISNAAIKHVEWISSTRVLAWSEANSGSNKLFVVDFKAHRVKVIFERPGMAITNVVFNEKKQFFFVIINGFLALLFQNRTQMYPRQVMNFPFKTNILVSFFKSVIIFIDDKNVLHITGAYQDNGKISKEVRIRKRVHLKLKKEHGSISSACQYKDYFYLGTTTGYVLKIGQNDLIGKRYSHNVTINCLPANPGQPSTPATPTRSNTYTFTINIYFNEVVTMKDKIKKIRIGPENTLLVRDIKDNVIIFGNDEEIIKLPNMKYVRIISPSLFLVHKQKSTCVEVIQSVGQYEPSYPSVAACCPMMMPRHVWEKSLFEEDVIDIATCYNYGMSYIASLIKAKKTPNFAYEQILFLRDLIMNTPQLWIPAFRLSIFLRDFETAQHILVNVPPTDSKWQISMIKSSLFFDFNEFQLPSVLFSAKNLINNNFVTDGIDLLLISGLWIDAVKMLINLSRYTEAALIARVYRDEDSIDVISDVVKYLIDDPSTFAYALVILCESGLDVQVVRELQNLGQSIQAKVLHLVE